MNGHGHIPQRGPKRAQMDEEEIQSHLVSKAEAVRQQAAERLYRSAVAQNKKKKELAEKHKPRDCTFKPKLAASVKKRETAVMGKKPAHERMYRQAKEALQKKKDVRKQLSDPKNFKPKMASKSTRTKLKSSSEDFLTRLAKDGAARKARARNNERMKQTGADLKEGGYTFKPNLSRRAKSVRAPSPMERVSNYKKQAAEKEAKRAALQAKYEMQNCSFKPKMSRSRSAPKARVRGSFLERQKENEAKHKSKMNRLLTEKERALRESVSGKPKVKVNKEMLRAEDTGKPLHERLYDAGTEKLRTRKLSSTRVPLDKECTFKPKIRRSKSAPRARQTSDTPIHERLYEENARQKALAKKAQAAREKELLKNCSFKPRVRKNKAVGGAQQTSDEPIWERLNVEKEKKDKMLRDKEKARDAREKVDCTFAPAIKYHPAHEAYDEDEPIWERLHAEPIGFSAEEPTGADQETFQPQINEASEAMVMQGRDDSEPIHERLFSIDVKKQLEEREKEKEKRELMECTFNPERVSTKNKEVRVQDDSDVFDRLQSRQTESMAAKHAEPPPPPKITPKKTSKKDPNGLSFLERMAQASAKQKSAHTTPPRDASTPSRNVVRRVPRPKPIPRPVPAPDDGPSLPAPAASVASPQQEAQQDDEEEEEDEQEQPVHNGNDSGDEESGDEEGEEDDESEEEEEDDDDEAGPMEF